MSPGWSRGFLSTPYPHHAHFMMFFSIFPTHLSHKRHYWVHISATASKNVLLYLGLGPRSVAPESRILPHHDAGLAGLVAG